ncbi:MAG: S8 family serine peptidase [Nitrospirota bacterium]
MKQPLAIALFSIICLAVSCSDDFPDPLYQDQWYLHGDRNSESKKAVDINLAGVEETGGGVVVAVIDNGLDMGHEDLQANIITGGVNYLEDGAKQTPGDHGTAAAGLIAATAYNGVGIHGVAPNAKIAGSNVLRAASISNLAHALSWEKEKVWVSSNSWGDFNSWGVPIGLRNLVNVALEEGTRYGRNGLGTIYVFSAGNGGESQDGLPTDNVNYSGLVNNRYVIPVCAVNEQGKRSIYSEVGAPLIVCAPSNDDRTRQITTTDMMGEEGYNPNYSKNNEVVLTSPDGTTSRLAERHLGLFDFFRYAKWRFGSMRHLGERSLGTWKLTVKDRGEGQTGAWQSWGIKIYGTQGGVRLRR